MRRMGVKASGVLLRRHITTYCSKSMSACVSVNVMLQRTT